MFSEEMFKDRIAYDNPWWSLGKINDTYARVHPRRLLESVYAQLTDWELRRALILLGPRRVGKTWLMQHVVGRLLAERFVPAHAIVFISIDVPVYHGSGLEELLLAAARSSGVDPHREKMVVLFDKIQYLKDWEIHLKTLAEAYPNIRFMASGSAATALSHGSQESGAGRFSDILLGPLTFDEFLELTGESGNFEGRLERLNNLFLEYVNFGGYPELVMNRTVQSNPVQFIQRDIVDKVLLRDLPSLYHIEDVRELQSFFSYLAFHSGMIQSWETLAQGAGLRKQQITAFMRYLEEAFLISRLDRVDISAVKLQRATQFKVYLTNTSLRASMFQPVRSSDDAYLGYAVETAISAQLGVGPSRAEWRYANWKTGRGQGEVDFVHIHPGTQRPDIALEVKWSDGPFDHPAELRAAISFCERNAIDRLWVTTRTQQGVKHVGQIEVVYTPSALFARALGRGTLFK